MSKFELLHGDCLSVMDDLISKGVQVDSVVTDPPYELGFMGKSWDSTGIAFNVETWKKAYSLLKPGGYLLAFSGSRTFHRMASAIEDAGFTIRDEFMWLYGSGFPKSLDISKAIDKKGGNPHIAAEIGEALKEARETRGMSITECDKLFCGGTTNWSWFEGRPKGQNIPSVEVFTKIVQAWPELSEYAEMVAEAEREILATKLDKGNRNVAILSGENKEYHITASATDTAKKWDGWGTALKPGHEPIVVATKGEPNPGLPIETSSRFYYSAKANKKERHGSKHPTIKPLEVMKHLTKLVTPKGGKILEPFAGSGTTGEAALFQGYEVILIEREAQYIEDIKRRLDLFGLLEF